MKKTFLATAAILSVMAFAVPSFASQEAGENGSIEITVNPVAFKGRDYSYIFTSVSFKPGYGKCLMDYKYEKDLAHTAVEAANDVYVAIEDLKSVYAPDFQIEAKDGLYTITNAGLSWILDAEAGTATDGSQTYTFINKIRVDDGTLLIPALETMKTLFGRSVSTGSGYYNISLTLDEIAKSGSAAAMDLYLNGEKHHGFRYLTYIIEDDPDEKVLPVRLYIPSCYDPENPCKAILMLHGGSQSMDYFFSDTSRAVPNLRSVEMYAEENGYLLIAPTAYVKSGDYGEYKADASEEKIATTILSEKSVITALQYVESVMNIDEDHLYIFGQSMGGFGTAFIGNKYADLFDGFAICACLRDIDDYDENPYPNLVDRPVLFVKGTEDTADGGFDFCYEKFLRMNETLHNMEFVTAAGGVHSTGWCLALPQVFEFLNRQVENG